MQKVIALDGPSASGKSTAAAAVAAALNIPYVNTGNMFRAVALAALAAGTVNFDTPGEAEIAPVLDRLDFQYVRNASGAWELAVNGEFPGAALRRPEISSFASRIASLANVRAKLKAAQRAMAENGWLVMEGRDIGTVIFPDAAYKFFITASPIARARRRFAQSGEVAPDATLNDVAAEIARRDELDRNRVIAPLRAAADAITIDNSEMSAAEVTATILEKIGNGLS